MTLTVDEQSILTGYVEAMGNDLGTTFFQLSRKLIELHIVWQQYRQLYGSDEETIFLLNRTAGLFFKIVQDQLWDSVLLGISRMTDSPSTAGKKNLTIQSLKSLILEPGLQREVEALCKAAVDAASYAREHRNKRIAHQDHSYIADRASNPLSGISRQSVETMLAALRDLLNKIDGHYRDAMMLYEKFVDSTGAMALVSNLKRLERLSEAAKHTL